MKLSEIKGERVFDVIADIMPPLCNIAYDPEAAALFDKRPLPEGMTTREFGVQWLCEATEKLIRNHKKDCIAILASIDGVSVKQYTKELDFGKLFNDFADLISDDTFRALFLSARPSTETSSGSASENTTE